MKYYPAYDLEIAMKDIVRKLEMKHVQEDRIACFRSRGSCARGVIARCHGLSKIQQLGLRADPFYVIEIISETFDKLSEEEKVKTLIHELMHIPHNFGGGFRHHNFVNRKSVNELYKKLLKVNNPGQ